MLIVLAEGEFVWDRTGVDFDWSRTTALPGSLRGQFKDEPLCVDLRWAREEEKLSLRNSQFRSAILDLHALLHGIDKDQLDGEDVRQYRKTRRLMWSVIILLLALTLTSSIAAYVAYEQRKEAVRRRNLAIAAAEGEKKAREEEARQRKNAEEKRDEAIRQSEIALSRQLAANSTYFLTKDVALSLLLSVEATYKQDTLEARKILFARLTHLANTERFIHFKRGQLIGVSFSSNQRFLGLTREAIPERNAKIKGRALQLWDIKSGRKVEDKLEEPRSSLEPSFSKGNAVRFSPDGRYLALATCQT